MSSSFSVFRKIDASPAVAVHGQVVTKEHIVEMMLDLAGYHGEREVTVLDPGCGEGAFIVAVARRLILTNGVPNSFSELAECLLGIEKDEVAAAACQRRLSKVLLEEGVKPRLAEKLAAHWVRLGDFLEEELPQFQLVVGNPPYVRQEAIPKAKLETYRAMLDCFYDRADLYVAFFEKGLKLLKEGGRLAFICPDRFAKNQYGKKLRAFIAERYSVECVIDLAQASPFEVDVMSYPGIFIVKRARKQRHVHYFRLTEASPVECDYVRQRRTNGVVTYHRFEEWFRGEEKWSVESPAHVELLRRLEHGCVPLGEAGSACRVGIGVATGADKVFIVPQDTAEVEPSLLMPLVTTRDISSGAVEWQGKCVINPFVGDSTGLIDLNAFPLAQAYFERHRAKLQGRNVAKRDSTRWYRTIDRIYPWLQRKAKLLIPDIKADSLIVLEKGELYPHHNLYYVTSDYWDLQCLRTILRSCVGRFFVWMYGVRMRDDYLRFQAQYLRRVCVPHLASLNKSALKALRQADGASSQDEIDEAALRVYGIGPKDAKLLQEISLQRKRS